MIYDFEIEAVLRLSSIKRWGIVEMLRTQSVAEHSYNVAMISLSIIDNMTFDDHAAIRASALEWALCHDLPELVTGDIPTPVKTKLGVHIGRFEASEFPELEAFRVSVINISYMIVKVADYIEAITYAVKYCVDSRKSAILDEMRSRLNDLVLRMEIQYPGFRKAYLYSGGDLC